MYYLKHTIPIWLSYYCYCNFGSRSAMVSSQSTSLVPGTKYYEKKGSVQDQEVCPLWEVCPRLLSSMAENFLNICTHFWKTLWIIPKFKNYLNNSKLSADHQLVKISKLFFYLLFQIILGRNTSNLRKQGNVLDYPMRISFSQVQFTVLN